MPRHVDYVHPKMAPVMLRGALKLLLDWTFPREIPVYEDDSTILFLSFDSSRLTQKAKRNRPIFLQQAVSPNNCAEKCPFTDQKGFQQDRSHGATPCEI